MRGAANGIGNGVDRIGGILGSGHHAGKGARHLQQRSHGGGAGFAQRDLAFDQGAEVVAGGGHGQAELAQRGGDLCGGVGRFFAGAVEGVVIGAGGAGQGIDAARCLDQRGHRAVAQVGKAGQRLAHLDQRAFGQVDLRNYASELVERGRIAQAVEHAGGPRGQANAVERGAHVCTNGGQVFGAAGAAVREGAKALAAGLPVGEHALHVADEQAAPGAILTAVVGKAGGGLVAGLFAEGGGGAVEDADDALHQAGGHLGGAVAVVDAGEARIEHAAARIEQPACRAVGAAAAGVGRAGFVKAFGQGIDPGDGDEVGRRCNQGREGAAQAGGHAGRGGRCPTSRAGRSGCGGSLGNAQAQRRAQRGISSDGGGAAEPGQQRGARSAEAADVAQGADEVAGGAHIVGAGDRASHRADDGLDGRPQDQRLEQVGERVAQVLRKGLARLKPAHQGVGETVADGVCRFLPLFFGFLGGLGGFFGGLLAELQALALARGGDQALLGVDLLVERRQHAWHDVFGGLQVGPALFELGQRQFLQRGLAEAEGGVGLFLGQRLGVNGLGGFEGGIDRLELLLGQFLFELDAVFERGALFLHTGQQVGLHQGGLFLDAHLGVELGLELLLDLQRELFALGQLGGSPAVGLQLGDVFALGGDASLDAGHLGVVRSAAAAAFLVLFLQRVDDALDVCLAASGGQAVCAGGGNFGFQLLGFGAGLVFKFGKLDAGLVGAGALGGGFGATLFKAHQLLKVRLLFFELGDGIVPRHGKWTILVLALSRCDLRGDVGQTLVQRVLAPDAEHLVPGVLGNAAKAAPGALDHAKIALQRGHIGGHGVGKGLLRQGGGFAFLAVILERANLLIDGRGEVTELLVELERCFDRRLAQILELLDGVFDRRANGAIQADGDLGKLLQVVGRHPPTGGQRGQGLGGLALRAADGSHGARHVGELADAGAGGVAREDDGLGKGVGFFGALVIGQRHGADRGGQNGVGVDQPGDVAAQRLGGRPDAAKHVFELATLLEQHRHGRLAALQTGDDVGELRRHAAQGGCGLGGGYAHLVEAGAAAGQGGAGGALLGLNGGQLVEVGLERLATDAALGGQRLKILRAAAAAGFHGGRGALNAADQALGGNVHPLGGGIAIGADSAYALAGLLASGGGGGAQLVQGALGSLDASLHPVGIGGDAYLCFQVVGHGAGRSVFFGKLLQRGALQVLHVVKELVPLVRAGGGPVEQRIEGGVDQPGGAVHADVPLGAQTQKQLHGGPVFGPDLEGVGLIVLGVEPESFHLLQAGQALIQRVSSPGQFPRRPSVTSTRYVSMIAVTAAGIS